MIILTIIYAIVGVIMGAAGVSATWSEFAKRGFITNYITAILFFFFLVVTWPIWLGLFISKRFL